jgi:hypothetical protein
LAEVAEYVGWQLYNPNDTSGAIKAALLLRHLLEKYPAVFDDLPRWRGGGALPGVLGLLVERQLNSLAERLRFGPPYTHLGLDAVAKLLESDQLVREFRSRSIFNCSTTLDKFAMGTPGVDDNQTHVHRTQTAAPLPPPP